MKRLDIVNGKIKKLSSILFDTSFNNSSNEDIELVKSELRRYVLEKKSIYQRNYDKRMKEMPWLKKSETYKELLTPNVEFNALFLELIHKYPYIVDDMSFLMPIVNFINGGDKLVRLRELLSMRRYVFIDCEFLNKINHPNYENMKEIFRSLTLTSSNKFREFFKGSTIRDNRIYDNSRLMERALKEGLDTELVMALGSKRHADEYFRINMSKELLDHINSAKTKTLKKQILSVMYDCNDEKILNILVRFFEIDEVREQLLDENSFYYSLLIKAIDEGVSHREYGSIDELLSRCSKDFDNYILYCNNTDSLSHSFDLLTGPYIYYHRDRRIHAVPVNRFTNSFNQHVTHFNEALETINMLDEFANQEYISEKFSDVLNDDLRALATASLIENEDIKMSEEEVSNWNSYIDSTYGYLMDGFGDNIEVTIGYGLDLEEEAMPLTMVYPCYRQIINSKELMKK